MLDLFIYCVISLLGVQINFLLSHKVQNLFIKAWKKDFNR